jgi:hypothetical protein
MFMNTRVLVVLSFVTCFGLCAESQADASSPVHIDDLLKPIKVLHDIECVAPKAIQFLKKDEATFSLSGTLSGKRATIVLRPEAGSWDISAYSYVRVDLMNTGTGLVWIQGRLDNKGAENWHNSTPSMAYVMPGERVVLGFAYPRAADLNDADAIFDSQSGKPNGHRMHWKPFDPEAVIACRLLIQSSADEISLQQMQVSLAQPYGVEANASLMELPYLDAYGQVRQLDWQRKLQDESELSRRHADEAHQLAMNPGPDAFNEYGGWASGPQLAATGFFRTEQYKGRWWLVDPSGQLFFSHGANSTGFAQKTPIQGREALFAWLPKADDSAFEGVVKKSNAHFVVANLIRTFGPDWQEAAYERVHRRMRQWGMNTIGAWSDAQLLHDRKTPYTTILHIGHGYSPLGHGISDPFAYEFKQALRKGLAKMLHQGRQDAWCVGAFIDNEIDWSQDFVRTSFLLGKQQPVRVAVIACLREKYESINDLNTAWSTEFAEWEQVSAMPDEETDGIVKDISMLRHLIAGEYYQQCRDAMREVLPDLLYLGSRMHKAPDEVMEEAIRSVDVLSLNAYEPLASGHLPSGLDKPALVSEFHFAAPDRGVPGTGLWPIGDQLQRSRAYVGYVMAGVLHPNVVGTHWFAYTDQSAAGRPGENFQIGFVDVTDTPYPIITGASRDLANVMYYLVDRENLNLLEALERLWGNAR